MVPYCAFTNAHSNKSKSLRKEICCGSNINEQIRKQCYYIGCRNCCDSKCTIWRCTECYYRFQKKITNNNFTKMVKNPIFDFLITTNFNEINYETVHEFANIHSNFLVKIVCPWNYNNPNNAASNKRLYVLMFRNK